MPYIESKKRANLDNQIGLSVEAVKSNIDKTFGNDLSDEDFLKIVGDINYFVSRFVSQLMGQTSYSKIALITGVLENIKQEFYRRKASIYEDKKINQNGDIKEYE